MNATADSTANINNDDSLKQRTKNSKQAGIDLLRQADENASTESIE